MIGICALNSNHVFIQSPDKTGKWYQYKLDYHEFILIMWDNFPKLMKKSIPYHFDNDYSIINWLYNIGNDIHGNMMIFDNENNSLFYSPENRYKVESQFRITNKTEIYYERR